MQKINNDSNISVNQFPVWILLLQGLIRYYRPVLEQRMKEYHDKKAAAQTVAAGKSIAAGQGWHNAAFNYTDTVMCSSLWGDSV